MRWFQRVTGQCQNYSQFKQVTRHAETRQATRANYRTARMVELGLGCRTLFPYSSKEP